MKTLFILVLVALAVWGIYNKYLKSESSQNTTIVGDALTVDTGDYEVKFSAAGDLRETYMIFGGGYFNNKKLINPIVLSGLEISDAKNIYARYPDFHRCASPGAAIAKPKVVQLNLIPSDSQVLNELKETVKQHEKNFANKEDRVCVSLAGSFLEMESAIVHEDNIDIKDQLPKQTFRLINSSERINCKDLLDQA